MIYNQAMTKIFQIDCPEYNFETMPDLKAIGQKIEGSIVNEFNGQHVILRCVQSGKHNHSKQELIDHILSNGTDYYQSGNENATNMADKKIDTYGYDCTVGKSDIGYHMLEGFHLLKPKCLEKPQYPVDIWMIYDPDQLENVEYLHQRYNVIARDAYIFKDPANKTEALKGIFIIS